MPTSAYDRGFIRFVTHLLHGLQDVAGLSSQNYADAIETIEN
jgi:hypothetical protein